MNKVTSSKLFGLDFLEKYFKFKGTTMRGDPRIYADINNFEIRDDDVWLCGFMRSGTHWATEMIWRIANDVSIENTALLRDRFLCFDTIILNGSTLFDLGLTYDATLSRLKNLPSPRFLKTHLPFHLLPKQLKNGEKKVKMIYIARNPKDVCVSCFYYFKHFSNFKGNLEDMCNLFITDKLLYTPYWDNVLGFWQKRKEFNILFLKYEDMKHDLPAVIRKTAEFLGKELTEEQVTALSAHLSFENCHKNPSLTNQDIAEIYTKLYNHKETQGFVRKGTAGQWQQEMSADTVRRLDQWIENGLRNSDYEI